eukprot:1245624-Rhodomonas_salina.1
MLLASRDVEVLVAPRLVLRVGARIVRVAHPLVERMECLRIALVHVVRRQIRASAVPPVPACETHTHTHMNTASQKAASRLCSRRNEEACLLLPPAQNPALANAIAEPLCMAFDKTLKRNETQTSRRSDQTE